MIVSFKHRGLKRLYEKGDRSGIRADLRIIFRFSDGQAQDVELLDYH